MTDRFQIDTSDALYAPSLEQLKRRVERLAPGSRRLASSTPSRQVRAVHRRQRQEPLRCASRWLLAGATAHHDAAAVQGGACLVLHGAHARRHHQGGGEERKAAKRAKLLDKRAKLLDELIYAIPMQQLQRAFESPTSPGELRKLQRKHGFKESNKMSTRRAARCARL